jgi:hypothetical protein
MRPATYPVAGHADYTAPTEEAALERFCEFSET